MNLIKLGKKGQVSIPQGVLRQLGIAPDAPLLVETTEDGAIVLRQVSVHPVEIYSDERLAEFARENTMTPAQAARAKPLLTRFNAWMDAKTRPAEAGLSVAEPTGRYAVVRVPAKQAAEVAKPVAKPVAKTAAKTAAKPAGKPRARKAAR